MPFSSKAQRRFMYAKHPALAKEFEAKTPKDKPLPQHVKKRKQTQNHLPQTMELPTGSGSIVCNRR